jgi:ABC-type transport system involved in cytochrome bd biosynthesis fused ATPase/permease subunit
MSRTLGRLLSLAEVPRSRIALAVALGSLTVIFGVGLMATAGYLISRAAEHPAVLSLTVAIVGVRFFGLARPLVRYLERLTSHDVALRALARVRVRVYERLERLSPTQLSSERRGDLLARIVSDVDALQNLHLRGIAPPLVALCAGTVAVGAAAAFQLEAALVLAAGLLVGGVAVPVTAASLARRASRRRADARGNLTSELVETLAGSAELVAFGCEEERLETLPARRARGRDRGRPPPAGHRSDPGRGARGRDLRSRGRKSRPRADRDARAPGTRVLRGGPAAAGSPS